MIQIIITTADGTGGWSQWNKKKKKLILSDLVAWKKSELFAYIIDFMPFAYIQSSCVGIIFPYHRLLFFGSSMFHIYIGFCVYTYFELKAIFCLSRLWAFDIVWEMNSQTLMVNSLTDVPWVHKKKKKKKRKTDKKTFYFCEIRYSIGFFPLLSSEHSDLMGRMNCRLMRIRIITSFNPIHIILIYGWWNEINRVTSWIDLNELLWITTPIKCTKSYSLAGMVAKWQNKMCELNNNMTIKACVVHCLYSFQLLKRDSHVK